MDWITDAASGARLLQAMVPMRDGVVSTRSFSCPRAGARFPVILHRTPYGIAPPTRATSSTSCMPGCRTRPKRCAARSCAAGAPSWRTAMPRFTRTAAAATAPRARTASMPMTRRTATTRSTGSRPALDEQRVGMSGSSAGATTTFAAASTRHPSLRAFFAQAGGSSIYDDVVYEGQSIEMERLWLWVSRNIPGLSAVAPRRGEGAVRRRRRRTRRRRRARGRALQPARRRAPASPPFVSSPDWMHLPLSGYPDFATWQPFLDEIISHPAPDDFRRRHNFRPPSTSPGFTSRAGSTSSRPASLRRSRTSRRAPARRSCGSGRTSITLSMPRISGRATRISNGSAIG